jgi:hypothetical protein
VRIVRVAADDDPVPRVHGAAGVRGRAHDPVLARGPRP